MLDYVNACQDTTDDVKAGVRSMAVRYRNTGIFIAVFGTFQVCFLVVTGALSGLSSVYMLIAGGGNSIMLLAMACTVDRSEPDTCAWWYLHGSVLVQGTTVVALFVEYTLKLLQ